MSFLSQSNFLQALGWAVLNSLWQMALLWVVFQILTSVFKVTKPAHRSGLATFFLFSGFAWFALTFAFIVTDASADQPYTSFLTMDGNSQAAMWLTTTLPIASILYLILLILPALNFIRNYRYVQVIRKYGLSKADVDLRMFVQRVSSRMGITRNVQIWMSEFVNSPLTIGYLKPVVLIPMAAVNQLSTEQIEAVLLHELAHIRRMDYLLNLVCRVIQSVLYFNPFVKAFVRIIERERERDCDEMVLQFQYEPRGYASALLTLEKASVVPQFPLTVPAAGSRKNELLGRVESILGIQKNPVFSFNKLAGLMGAVLCFISMNALLLLANPQARKAGTEGNLAQLTAPYSFFSDDATEETAKTIVNKVDVVNKDESLHEVAQNAPQTPEPPTPAAPAQVDIAPSMLSYVSHIQKIMPHLEATQELQVSQALNASKRVLEEVQWKAVEKNIADAMTTAEKTQVKLAYKSAADQADWDKMGDNLRLAYDKIDWPVINAELNTALASIKLDSLNQVYNLALTSLTELEVSLKQADQKGVPDSDITILEVEKKKKEVERAVNKLRTVKTRKTIHL